MSQAVPTSLPSGEQSRQEAEALLRHPSASVSVVGPRPWARRGLSRMLGPATALLLYATALTPLQLGVGTLATGVGAAALVNQVPRTNLFGLPSAGTVLMSPVALRPLFGPTVEAFPSVAVHPAVFDVPAGMTAQQVAQKLYALGHPFQALAVTLEGIETKPYRDVCGLNVGMGYCIDARLREHGVARVQQDLLRSGLGPAQVADLLGNDRRSQDAVRLTRTQALSLLSLTESDYRVRARDLIGPKVFDALPQHRQAALTWLSYNTGEGLGRFSRLLTAVRQDRTGEAVEHMTPFFAQNGQMVPNARAGAWLMAAYWSDDAFKAALARPDALESGARNGQSPLEIVAPHEAGRLALNGALPASPYVTHGGARLEAPAEGIAVAMANTEPHAAVRESLAPPAPLDEWRARRDAERTSERRATVASAPPAPLAEVSVRSSAAPSGNGLGLDVGDLMDNLPSAGEEPAPRRRTPRP